MESLSGDKWQQSRKLTPEHWRYVRIVPADNDKFSVVGYITYSRFGPMAMLAMGQDVNTRTQEISHAAALALGAKLEKAFIASNTQTPKKRK